EWGHHRLPRALPAVPGDQGAPAAAPAGSAERGEGGEKGGEARRPQGGPGPAGRPEAVDHRPAGDRQAGGGHPGQGGGAGGQRLRLREVQDRKSTRLNSSHVSISYAVFCLKKKTK